MGFLFVNLMAYGGAVVSLFNPFVGFLIYVCFAVLKPEAVWPWSIGEGNYSRIVALALLTGWGLKGFGRWDLGRGKAVILALLAYFAWVVVGATQAPEQAVAWTFVENYAKIILPILVGITTIDSVRRLKLLVWVILLSQAYPAFYLNQMYFSGYNMLKEDGFAGFDNNSYAISLVTCTGLAGILFWYSEKWWQKAVAAASFAFIAHAVLFSFSRGGMLGLIVLGLAAFSVMPKGPKELSAFALAVVLGLALAGPQVRARFQSSFAEDGQRDYSAESRLELWTACWDTMQKHPVFGVGPDHMPLVIDQYGFRKGKESHTLWLQLGAELGFPGLILLLSYYGLCVIRLWPIARGRASVPDPWLVYLARMVIASIIGFAVSAQFVSLEFLETPYYVAMVGAGVLTLSSANPRSARETPQSRAGGASGRPPRMSVWPLRGSVRDSRRGPNSY